MQSQGELMQILGDIEAARKALRHGVAETHEEIEASLRSLKNKAIVDAITTHYEARERIETIQNEIISHIKDIGRG